MRKTTKPLTLRRQTLRPLVADELARVVGGGADPNSFNVKVQADGPQGSGEGGHGSICTRDISGCMPP